MHIFDIRKSAVVKGSGVYMVEEASAWQRKAIKSTASKCCRLTQSSLWNNTS